MATILDSVAAFIARAKSLGLPDEQLNALKQNHAASFGSFAWIAPFNSTSGDDAPLIKALTDQFGGTAPTSVELVHYRRLHFEAHAMTIADTKARVERVDENQAPKKLPAPERAARFEAQKKKLPYLVWNSVLEPSHMILDKVQQQLEENVAAYISLDVCTSRQHEAENVKKLPDPVTLSDHMLRTAFRRRALAFDQANLIDYMTLEHWTERLFSAMSAQVPPGYSAPGKYQILAADKQLFMQVMDECRSSIAPTVDSKGDVIRPLDVAIRKLWDTPSIAIFMMPFPSSSKHAIDKEMDASESNKRFKKDSNKSSAPQRQASGKGKKAAKLPPILQGCWTHVRGRLACRWFNMGSCRSDSKPGEACKIGVHACMTPGCGENHPHISCPKKGDKGGKRKQE